MRLPKGKTQPVVAKKCKRANCRVDFSVGIPVGAETVKSSIFTPSESARERRVYS